MIHRELTNLLKEFTVTKVSIFFCLNQKNGVKEVHSLVYQTLTGSVEIYWRGMYLFVIVWFLSKIMFIV